MAILALIITSIFCVKKGASDQMDKEITYLDRLVASTTCTCA